jgi:cell division protein FtsB
MPTANPAGASGSGPAGVRRAPGGRGTAYFILLFVACVLVLNAVVGEKGMLTMFQARREYEELVASVERAKAENAQLREDARRLSEDPDAIEDVARRELGLILPGEKLFIVNDVPPTPKANAQK